VAIQFDIASRDDFTFHSLKAVAIQFDPASQDDFITL
jgi:hypothetical protein